MTRETLRDELQMAHDLLDLMADPLLETPRLDYLFGVFNKAQSLYESGQFDRASEFLNSFWIDVDSHSFWRAVNERTGNEA